MAVFSEPTSSKHSGNMDYFSLAGLKKTLVVRVCRASGGEIYLMIWTREQKGMGFRSSYCFFLR